MGIPCGPRRHAARRPLLGRRSGRRCEAGIIRNGVFAALPDAFGISLGYTNDPTTFKNRSTPAPSTRSMACKAQTSGRIYLHSGPRTELHEIIRQEYARHQDRAVPRNTLRQAVQGMPGGW